MDEPLGFPENPEDIIRKLLGSERDEAKSLSRERAKAIVGMYYSLQKLRINAGGKISAHERQIDILADSELIKRMKADLEVLERQAASALGYFAKGDPLGRWCLSNRGCGPVITAALLAMIDLKRCTCIPYRGMKQEEIPKHKCNGLATAGAIWKFAGICPDIKWEAKQKRPYCAMLRVTCWKLGTSFKMNGKHPDCFYGHIYHERKKREEQQNEKGLFAEQALARLHAVIKQKRNISPEQRKIWSEGKLQQAGLDLRAMRYAVKIFLSHYHTVGREILGLPEVRPWVLVHGGHSHYIPPPNWPMEE